MVNTELAHLSDALFTTAIATYSVAMVGYCAEYAFGRKGRIADTVSGAGTAAATATTAAAKSGVVRVVAPASASRPASDRVRVLSGSSAGSAGPSTDAVDVDRALIAEIDAIGTNDSLSADSLADGSPAIVTGGPSAPPVAPGPPSAGAGGPSLADRIGRLAVGVTVLGALIHLASVAIRGIAVDRVPWGNMYEFSAVAGLIAVLAWLAVLVRLPALRYLGMFVLTPVIVLMFLAGNVLYAKAQPLVPALQSYWLAIHVSAAASGEGMLMTSAVLAILYLVKVRYDRRVAAGLSVRAGSLGARLPDPAALDKASYRIVAFAFPIYTFGVICGAIWAEAAWGRYWGWDPKETWAFIAWVIYAAYLHARATAGWKGRNAAFINVLGFAAMSFNFFVINIFVTGLHSYAGLN